MAYTQQQSMIKPDYKPKKLPYSCEEIYERMDNGLCLFCEEHDTPGHYQLKHKGVRIFMTECDDDIEEVHQIQKAVKNPDPFVETDPLIEPLECVSVLQVLDSVPDRLVVHRVDSHVKEVEKSSQQSTNGNDKISAHKLFDQMPLRISSKEKQRKYLKAWKFKFKPTSKRSKSMDVKFFSVEEIAWFTKDAKEINWGCVNKEFKEVVAGCGKKVIDRFKLVDETSKSAVCDGTFQTRVWDCGGSLLECVDESYCNGKSSGEAILLNIYRAVCLGVYNRNLGTDLEIYLYEYKNQMLSLGYHGLEVQVLSGLQEFGEGSKTDTRMMLCWKKLASFLWFLHGKKLLDAGQKMHSMLVSDFKTWVPHFGYELCLAGIGHVLGLVSSSFESDMSRLWRGPEVVLSFNSENLDWFFQRDLHKSCLDIRRMIILLCSSADYRKLNLWVDTNYCAIQPDKTHVKLQEMGCFLSEKSLVEFVGYKAHGRELLVMGVKQLTLAATKFHLKHKWRFRLLQSFSRLILLALFNLWFSKTYELSGLLKDSSNGEAESFPILNFAKEQPLLGVQNNSEQILIISELESGQRLMRLLFYLGFHNRSLKTAYSSWVVRSDFLNSLSEALIEAKFVKTMEEYSKNHLVAYELFHSPRPPELFVAERMITTKVEIEEDMNKDDRKQQGDWRHSFLLVAAANWSPQMNLWSTSYHVWHRWKARYCFVGIISTMWAWLFGEEGFDTVKRRV